MDNKSYMQIFDNLPEGVAVCNTDRVILDVNKAFESLTKYPKSELIGKKLCSLIKLTKEACNVCQEPDNDSYQIGELHDKENNLSCIRINSAKTPDDKCIYLIIPFSNIAFLNQAHIDFVSTVSHELRTPLTSIKGFADTILSAGGSLSEEQKTKFVGIIKTQVDRLTRLVENLLTVSKLEARQAKPIYKAVEINKTIDNVIYGIQHKAKNHTIQINILPNLPPVWADSDKLEQVMMNLVDNAIKYSNQGTTVSINAGFKPDNPDMIEIKIKDQGFGIPQESLSKVFTKFSRIDSPLTRGVQGTGLGLYITKSLVQSMKGDISVESTSSGSTFTLYLPAASAEIYTKQKFQEK